MKKQIVFLLTTLLFLSTFAQQSKFISISNSKNTPTVELLPEEVIIDDADPRIIYTGGWQSYPDTNLLFNTQHYTDQQGAMCILMFSGEYINIYYYEEQGGGFMNAVIDDSYVTTIDCRSSDDSTHYHKVFRITGLTPGKHIIKLVHRGLRYDNKAPRHVFNNYPIIIDAFGVSKTDNR